MRLTRLTTGAMALALTCVMAWPMAQAWAAELSIKTPIARETLGTAIGRVATRSHHVMANNPALNRRLDPGSLLFVGDTISVLPHGALTFELMAGGQVRLGPGTELRIDHVEGDPTRPKALHLVLLKAGALRYQPADQAGQPLRLSVETPAGTATGPGADFWVGALDGAYAVQLYAGVVDLASLAGTGELTEPGTGVKLRGQEELPPKPVHFRQRQLDRIARSLMASDPY